MYYRSSSVVCRLRFAVLLLFVAFLTASAPARAAAGDLPVVLFVPAAGESEQDGRTENALNSRIEESLETLAGLVLADTEERENALAAISLSPRMGPDELSAISAEAGADYTVAGRYRITPETFELDLRLFDVAAAREGEGAVGKGERGEAFRIVADSVLKLAELMGVTVSESERKKIEEVPTPSLEAYDFFLRARAEEDLDRKIELLESALDEDPEYFEAVMRLGLEMYRVGLPEAALPHMRKAAELRPDIPETHNNLAVLLAGIGEADEAAEEFKKALKIDPHYDEAGINYARLLEEENRFDKAEKLYEDILERDGGNDKARAALALLYDRTRRPALAIREFKRVSRTSPALAEEYFMNAGQEARKNREFEAAEKYFTRAVDINPRLAGAYAALGTNSYLAEEYKKSVEYFRQALALEPHRPEFHHYFGLALEKGGRWEEAAKSYQRAVELGGPAESRLNLARGHLSTGEVARAIEELNRILVDDPGNAIAQEMLGRAMVSAESKQKIVEQQAEFATYRLERLEEIIDDLNKTNRELEDRLFSVQTQKSALERRLGEALTTGGRNMGLEQELEVLGKELASARDDVERVKKQYGDDLERLRSRLVLEEENARSQAKRAGELESQLTESRLQIRDLEAATADWEGKGRSALQEVEDLRETIAALRPENKEIGEELIRMREESTREMNSLREDLAESRKKVQILTESVVRLEGQLEVAEGSNRTLAADSAKLKMQSERDAREAIELGEKLSTLRPEKESLAGENRQLREDLDASGAREKELQLKVDKLELQLDGEKKKVRDLADDLVAEEEKAAEKDRRLEKMQEKLSSLEAAEEEASLLRRKLSDEGETSSLLSRRAESVQVRLEEEERRAVKLESELEKMKEKAERSGRERSELQRRYEAVEGERDGLKEELDLTRRQQADSAEEQKEELDRARRQQADRVKEQKEELDLARRQHADTVKALEEELARLRAGEDEASAAYDELKARMADVELASYQRIEDSRKESDSAMKKVRDELSAAREKEAELLRERESLRSTVAGLEAEAVSREERFQEALRSAEQSRELLMQLRRTLVGQNLKLGKSFMESRSWERAKQLYLAVLESDPSNAEAYYSLGEIYFQLGQFDLSRQMYEKAKEVY